MSGHILLKVGHCFLSLMFGARRSIIKQYNSIIFTLHHRIWVYGTFTTVTKSHAFVIALHTIYTSYSTGASAIFPVVHERNRCFYWFIVLWLLLTHTLLWKCMCISRCYLCSPAVLYCTVSTIQAISWGHSCSGALLNKDRRVDQLLPWRAPGLGTLCYPQLSILCKWFCSAGFVPRLFEWCWN